MQSVSFCPYTSWTTLPDRANMASYEEALAYVRMMGGARVTELARELGTDWGAALRFLELMERQTLSCRPTAWGSVRLSATPVVRTPGPMAILTTHAPRRTRRRSQNW